MAACLFGSCTALADLYDPARLETESLRIAPLIRDAFDGVLAALPPFDRDRADRLRLTIPLDGPDPLYYGARPATGTVVIPVETVLFLEETAALRAILDARGCDRDDLATYAAALLGGGERPDPPLAAFGLPPEEAEASAAARLAVRSLQEQTLHFLVAHQVAHLLRGTARGPSEIHSPGDEISADAYALDLLAAQNRAPGTVDLLFLLELWRMAAGRPAAAGAHPVTAERLDAVSQRLLRDRDLFRAAQTDQVARWELELLAFELRDLAAELRKGTPWPGTGAALPRAGGGPGSACPG
ncbi:hypothetical protein [Mangrovicoccus algicola]|uniref:Uncharacterized protein n=1 Tax=Mangrovicoccus algicola TaxID=2771008 RepID=A0A8J6YV25_9RHOB|nr:hypothetical protein [Mangrovicoccus algicola]MBE3638297.1 hypothetical protein [Mangrovicoccus algicola]